MIVMSATGIATTSALVLARAFVKGPPRNEAPWREPRRRRFWFCGSEPAPADRLDHDKRSMAAAPARLS